MTSDDQQPELEEALRSRLAAAIPPAPSVTGWAERAAARARKRKARRRQVLAVVSVSCVAAAIAIGAASFGRNGDSPTPDTNRGPAVAATPQPPAGMRYVGINSVAVAVPNDWDLRIGGCYDQTDENAVVVPSYSWPTCAGFGPRPDVSLLRILPTDDVNAEGLLEDARPAGEINGIRVLRTPTKSFANEWWEGALVVPEAEAIFWLEAPSTVAIERVFDTLDRIPDGYVGLPSAQAPWPCVRDRLEAAGMTVKVKEDDGSRLPPRDIISSKPTLGTVAKRGTTVTLTVPTGVLDACRPPPTAPGVEESAGSSPAKPVTTARAPDQRQNNGSEPTGGVAADYASPVAGICASPKHHIVTVRVNPDTPAPRCSYVRGDQALRVVNSTDAYGQPGRPVSIRFADRPQVTLTVGDSVTYTAPFGTYLAPGVHDVHLSVFNGGGAEIYLR